MLGAMPTLVVGMLAVSLRSLGKHGTLPKKWGICPGSLGAARIAKSEQFDTAAR